VGRQLGNAVTDAWVQPAGADPAAVSSAQNVPADTFHPPSTWTAVPAWLAASGVPSDNSVNVTFAWFGLTRLTLDTVAEVEVRIGELANVVASELKALAFCSSARRDATEALPLNAVTNVAVTAAVVVASAGEPPAALGVVDVVAAADTDELLLAFEACFELPQAATVTIVNAHSPIPRTVRRWDRAIVESFRRQLTIKVVHCGR
jgi:hypothetical protein